jgi:5-formyltetrahydrofolate cyclo-ligase
MSPSNDLLTKENIRSRIWTMLEELGAARPPRPVHGRIPNFVGADRATRRLLELEEFKKAEVVKVNPDSPQKPVREAVLRAGKILLTPTPRLRSGFLLVNQEHIPERGCGYAATMKGSFRYGQKTELRRLPKPDLLVVGSVAVTPSGGRVGKGGGYSELEYAILSELGLVDERTPIATTIHEIQIVEDLPMEAHDLRLDIIITPNRILRTHVTRVKAGSILWNKVTDDMISKMPILSELLESEHIKGHQSISTAGGDE